LLVLTRRPQQSLRIGHDVIITVLEIKGDSVRIGIEAPRDVDVHRSEVYDDLQAANQSAASPTNEAVLAFTRRVTDPKAAEPGPAE
jgi:carbon storage regulator